MYDDRPDRDWRIRARENIEFAWKIAHRRYGFDAATSACMPALRGVAIGHPSARRYVDRNSAVALICSRAHWARVDAAAADRRQPPIDPTVIEETAAAAPVVDSEAFKTLLWKTIARHFVAFAENVQKPELKLIAWWLHIEEALDKKQVAERLAEDGFLCRDTPAENHARVRQWFTRTAPMLRAAYEAAAEELGLRD